MLTKEQDARIPVRRRVAGRGYWGMGAGECDMKRYLACILS